MNVSMACFLLLLYVSMSHQFLRAQIHQCPIHIVTERNSINRFILERKEKKNN